jgi:predicted TIM-barrel fold metal-dependent hydrolase
MEHRYDHPMYEPLWAAAQDLDMPLSLHVGTYRWKPGTNPNAAAQDIVDFTNRECDARNAIAAMIYAGVFERYPMLRVGVVEFEVAWAPYFLARLGNVYTERAVGRKLKRFKDGLVPSDFFRRNVFISFQEDDLGIQLRSVIGVQNLLWGSDYPHAESTFPKSRQIVARILQDIPDEERAMIAGENAARLYHFH